MLRKLLNIFKVKEQQDFPGLYTDPPQSYADRFPEVPRPEPRLSLELLAARWASHDLYGEDMPPIAADLLEAGYDTPSLRRLAGETDVLNSADIEHLVGKTFRELSVPYPVPETEAKLVFTRQVAREVIAGTRNAWAAASHLEIAIWGWKAETIDLESLFGLNDEINWAPPYRRPIATLTTDLIETFARLAARTDREKRIISFGCLEGQGWIADDFDAPLPDEILAQFEGRDEPAVE